MSNGNGSTGSNDLDMLIKLMGMTGSSNDNEALAAMRLAAKWLTNRGHNWDDLLRGKVTVEADPFAIAAPAATRPTNTTTSSGYTQPPPRYRAPPPPPPPPTKWTNGATIQQMFDDLEFVSLGTQVQQQLNAIEARFKAQAFLMDFDYQYLLSKHSLYAPKSRSKRRRTR